MPGLFEDLRRNIRALRPTGPDGFEGLMAAVLCDLTKRSFALANSTSQLGMDGQSALDGGVIVFEGKLYDKPVPKDKVYSKLFEIGADKTSTTELYILGTTCPIPAQQINTLRDGARRSSIALMILAWPENGLPELAALMTMAPSVSAKFMAKHTLVSEAEFATQLAAVRAHPQFRARSDELSAVLQQPSIAPAFALQDNIAWLSQAFSDRKRARAVFGQALSPDDAAFSATIDRTDLRATVASRVFGKLDGAVTAILGADGNGKSWIFAQAWSHQSSRPLTVVIVPSDVSAPPSPEYCQDLLISKLLTQTGEMQKTEAKERWLRHFNRWENQADSPAPRLVVFVDGVNQRSSVTWVPFLDIMSEVVARLGGSLVFSCRRPFYRDNIENNLISRVIEIEVPEWTDPELDQLLKAWGSSVSVLGVDVVRSLRNPRIFGVAAELLTAREITDFGELSVNRLLFEHIRGGTAVEHNALSPRLFAAGMCDHAESIVRRLEHQQSDDVKEFELILSVSTARSDQTISDQFTITSAGRFFEFLGESPNRYILKDEGLPLALGLALVRKTQEALRKQKNVDEALANILDPIAALDKTCDILMGSIIAAVLGSQPKEVVAPLIRSFVTLQNLDVACYPEFRGLFARDPNAFLAALEGSTLTRDAAANLFWLTDAVNDLRGKPTLEAALVGFIRRWLSMYSTSPERRLFVSHNPQHGAERERARAESERELSATLAALTGPELNLLAGMIEENRGDYSQLSLLAFQSMAGRPLAPFAESLRNWCFAASLNGGYLRHHDEYDDLLHFNLADWALTKEALRTAATPLRQPAISSVGRWALVYVLRATGDGRDAREADQITEELTNDRELRKGWRRVEDYCATDPCDPASEAPDNIDKTVADYRAINLAGLRRPRAYSLEDSFFDNAQIGLARFRPAEAVSVLQTFAEQALMRPQANFCQAVSSLDNHTVGLKTDIALLYVEKAREIAQAALDVGEDENKQAWITAQCSLCVAFPHMTGEEQFTALINHPSDDSILVDLGCLFQPIGPNKLEHALTKAVQEDLPVTQFRILCFAEYSQTPLTGRTKEMVLSLLESPDDHVRLSVLSLAQATADSLLLAGVARSNWSAAELDAVVHAVEIRHGSQALALAAGQGLINLQACLVRIEPSAYERLLERLGFEAALAIAYRLDTAIHSASGFQVTVQLPEIEQMFDGRIPSWFVMVSEKAVRNDTNGEQLRRLSETGDAWNERQKRSREAAEHFERNLIGSGAQLIMWSVTSGLITRIDGLAPTIVDTWHAFFLTLTIKALSNVHNIALTVAEAVSKRNAASGRKLFKRLEASSPYVRITFGRERLSLDAVTAWGAADSDEMNALRFARLDEVGNDHDLAMEILAAIRAERISVLRDYVLERRQCPEPAHRARAVMVAGLSPDDTWAIETVDMLKDEHGFLGRAYAGAKYAMQRHQWSRHWASKMRTATDPVDLWRYAVLLGKIVDGRFDMSDVNGSEASELIVRFRTTLDDSIRSRIEKWKDKRQSKLFSMSAPSSKLLPSNRDID